MVVKLSRIVTINLPSLALLSTVKCCLVMDCVKYCLELFISFLIVFSFSETQKLSSLVLIFLSLLSLQFLTTSLVMLSFLLCFLWITLQISASIMIPKIHSLKSITIWAVFIKFVYNYDSILPGTATDSLLILQSKTKQHVAVQRCTLTKQAVETPCAASLGSAVLIQLTRQSNMFGSRQQ